MKKRLFLAINLPYKVRQDLLKKIQCIDWPQKAVSIIKPENYHLTLKFFGYLTRFEEDEIIQEINQLTEIYKTFKIIISKITLFPSEKQARYLVADLERNQTLKRIYYAFEQNYSFRPHVTLVRFKKNLSKNFFKKINKIKIKPIEVNIKSIELMQSQLNPKGARYSIVKKFNLKL